MKEKLTTTVMKNGKSILGVIAGLAIAGASLATAKLNSKGETDEPAEVDAEEINDDVAEETDEPAEEESGEE